MSHLRNFGQGLQAMLEHERSAAYAVPSGPSDPYNSFGRGGPPVSHLDPSSDDPTSSPPAPSAPTHIPYDIALQGSSHPTSWQQVESQQLDSMYESEFLETTYDPDFDRSPLSTYSTGHHSPYLSSSEDFLNSNLFNQSASPAFFVQPPTRNNTVLSPPLGDSLEAFRYHFQKGVSPESSIGDDYLSGEPGEYLGHRSRTHSRASSISSSHTQNLSASQFGTGASTSPALLPGDVPELSPHLNDIGNLQIGESWGYQHMSQSVGSVSGGSDAGSNNPSPYAKPMSPPALTIPSEAQTGGFDPNASLFAASQPGLAPPSALSLGALPSLGLIPATPVSPGAAAKMGFQEILRQQVAQRRAESPLLSGSQPSDNGSGSQVQSPPAPDTQTPWSTIVPQQPPMPPVPMPSMSDSNIFPHIGGPRPAIGAIPSGASNLGVYTTRSRSHSDPPSSQWGAALPPAIRPSPTHGQGPTINTQLNLPGINPTNILGNRVPDLNVGVGGSLWDNAIDPMLGPINGQSVHRARSVGDGNNRRGHNRNAHSEDVSSAFRGPEQGVQLYTAADGSLAPPSMSVPSSELDEGGVGPTRRRGHERSGSGSHRASPYASPHASPRMLPDDNTSYGGISLTKPVERVHVTTPATREASSNRRTAQANFKCPVPGCGSTFTRHFNLRGHIRSHNEERPFKCKWPGCDKGFARQHDCKRHEALHLNIRPYTCEGCQKTFARMDALNRHLRSEGGTECQRVQSEITEHPTENTQSTDWQNGSGNVVL